MYEPATPGMIDTLHDLLREADTTSGDDTSNDNQWMIVFGGKNA
jgi:hypothetical protein